MNLPTVSRQHAAIDVVGETLSLSNLSRTNPVYLKGGTRLSYHQYTLLQPGDTFRLGFITFEVQEAANVHKLRCAHCEHVVDYTCTGYLGYPFEKCATEDTITSFFAPVSRQPENGTVAHCAIFCSVLERIS